MLKSQLQKTLPSAVVGSSVLLLRLIRFSTTQMLDYDHHANDFKDFQVYGTFTFVNMPTYEVEQCALVYY